MAYELIIPQPNAFSSAEGYIADEKPTSVSSGATDVKMLKLAVNQTGTLPPIMEFDNVTFTTDNNQYVTGTTLYYSDTDDFSTATEVGTAVALTGTN